MNETSLPEKGKDHTKSVIIATTLVLMTCILSCAMVLILLILKIPS